MFVILHAGQGWVNFNLLDPASDPARTAALLLMTCPEKQIRQLGEGVQDESVRMAHSNYFPTASVSLPEHFVLLECFCCSSLILPAVSRSPAESLPKVSLELTKNNQK